MAGSSGARTGVAARPARTIFVLRQMTQTLVNMALDSPPILFKAFQAEQAIVVRRLILGKDAEPFQIGIERGHDYCPPSDCNTP